MDDTLSVPNYHFKITDYCADPFLALFIDRWRVSPIVIPLILCTLVTLIEFAWAIPNNFMNGRNDLVGILDDPAFYYSNWLGGGTIWLYYAWMPFGIQTMFSKLHRNGVIKITDWREETQWGEFMMAVKRELSSKILTIGSLVIALAAAIFIYFPSTKDNNGWSSWNDYTRFLVSAWMFVVLYAVVQVVLRQIYVSFLLSRMFKKFKKNINILPLHPDHAGGLAPLGSFALKSTYLITVIGFIIVFDAFTRYYKQSGTFDKTIFINQLVIAAIAYLIFAPITFLAPLATAHSAMHDAKDDLLLKLSQTFEQVYRQTYQSVIHSCPEDLKLDRLKKLQEFHDMTEKFPVWPFNAATLQRFFASVLSPVVLAVLSTIVGFLLNLIKPINPP